MIRRNTWILFAIFLAALGGAIWYSQRDASVDPDTGLPPTVEPLWFLPETDIEALVITDLETDERIRARRDPEVGWRLVEPEAEMANVARIERAVTSLQLIEPVQRLEAEELAPYGLDEPRYRIRLSLRDGTNRALQIGSQAPTGDVYYARLGETKEVLLLRNSTIQTSIDLLEVPPVVTPTPDVTATSAP